MRFAVLSIGLTFIAAEASHGTAVGPPPRDGWSATNQHGFCTLSRVEETSDTKLEFVFISGLTNSDVPKQVTFQINAAPATLAWPVRLSPGSDASAPDIEVGANSSPTTALYGAAVGKLLAYLKAGKGLDVEYSLGDGVERRLYLDTFKFSQSVAMFEACTAHVA